MSKDRIPNPANPNEADGREPRWQSSDDQNTQVGTGDQSQKNASAAPEHRNDDLEKDTDEYRQNQQEEIKPNVDGEDREDEAERPNTADSSRSSSSSNDTINGTSGSRSN
jgi:hypothetical protein